MLAVQGDGSPASICPLEDQARYDGPLPVELVAFEGVVDGQDVILRWETASETNNAGFEIEQRGPGEETFTVVGFVAGHGTTTEAQTYRHRLNDQWPGTHTLRLRQIDFDGSVSYSPGVEVDVDVLGAVLARTYPNPSNPQAAITMVLAEDQFAELRVFDIRGRLVARPFRQTVSANQTYTVQVGAGLPSGVYIAQLIGDHLERPDTLRFVIAR